MPKKAKPATKPGKPHKDFPLFAHANGYWAKKIKGKMHYFGPWANWKAALDTYLNEKDDLLAGRVPPSRTAQPAKPAEAAAVTLAYLCDEFLAAKRNFVESGELSKSTMYGYDEICTLLKKLLGCDCAIESLTPKDFGALRACLAKGVGPVTLANKVRRARVVFKWAYDGGHLIAAPLKMGQEFNLPSKLVLRKSRAAKPKRLFQADEIRKLLAIADADVKAMILLGINCGFGNSDCAALPWSAVDLDKAWLDFPRPKTGVDRQCPLWPETVAALRAVQADQARLARLRAKRQRVARDPKPNVFVTKYGNPWVGSDGHSNPISQVFRKLLIALRLYRPGLNFYALRHTLETIGNKTRDTGSVKAIMGHTPSTNDMSAVYDEDGIESKHLLAVVNYVREWLFPKEEIKKPSRKSA